MRLCFEHENLPQRAVFASYEAANRVADEVARLGGTRVMAIVGQAEAAIAEP
ncbi:MAG: hypothetical protein QOI51_854, partial [Nocardioidaceae bacterium]|nr:hypothetical protein [Nocardioidaceae bacterium]